MRTIRWFAGFCAAVAVATAATACGGSTADTDSPAFVYITNAPIGQNEFLQLGRTGTEAAAAAQGGGGGPNASQGQQNPPPQKEAPKAPRPGNIRTMTPSPHCFVTIRLA
ncbi:hypothetical protein [Nocardia carnea]|uniref:hypothetical protein n=1 Tax=Nocardia carnea TaxID=37328 RepID=UPI002453F02F|nr:hypothetical protein [Nocardia carnea]